MRLLIVNLSVSAISGGYEEYLRQFFSRAAKDSQVEAIMFVSVAPVIAKFRDMPHLICLEMTPMNALLGTLWGMGKTISDFRPDLVYVPMEKRLKGLSRYRHVMMLQNMEPFAQTVPGNSLAWRLILKVMRRRAITALKSASHVIVLSEFAAQGVARETGIKAKHISLIPHGISETYNAETNKPEGIATDSSFLFTAGSLAPARGVEDLIKAYIHLKKTRSLENVKLYIAGGRHRFSRRWLSKIELEIAREGYERDILWLGHLNRAEMNWCFKNTLLFVITSRVESFCITAVEAMAAQVPVISTKCPCLPETLADYPDYYQAGDWQQLAQKIIEVMAGSGEGTRVIPDNMISQDENYARTMALFNNL